MGKGLKLRKPKLKWSGLVPDRYMSIYEEHGFRMFISFMASVIPFFVGAACTFGGGPLLLGIPMLAIGAGFLFGFGPFGYLIPRLHWLYGMDRDQERALEWYDDLSEQEKKQLPSGWEALIREVGTDEVAKENARYSWDTQSVASEMYSQGQEVIRLYRAKNEIPKVEDYRVETYRELMRQRAAELTADIESEREIQDKIARMP